MLSNAISKINTKLFGQSKILLYLCTETNSSIGFATLKTIFMVTTDIYKKEYDVIIVGGGATGAGTARDCALRGLSVLLVERNDYSTGATGRNHGLMHSGARYAVTDGESASECISENMILRRIARHCAGVHENGIIPFIRAERARLGKTL